MTPIKFTLDGDEVEIHPKDFLDIGDDLNTAYHRFGHLWSLATEVFSAAKGERDRLRGKLSREKGKRYLELKGGEFKEEYGVKPTEDGIEHALEADEKLTPLQKKLVEVERAYNRLWDLRDGMKMKLELLKEVGAFVRQGRKLDN